MAYRFTKDQLIEAKNVGYSLSDIADHLNDSSLKEAAANDYSIDDVLNHMSATTTPPPISQTGLKEDVINLATGISNIPKAVAQLPGAALAANTQQGGVGLRKGLGQSVINTVNMFTSPARLITEFAPAIAGSLAGGVNINDAYKAGKEAMTGGMIATPEMLQIENTSPEQQKGAVIGNMMGSVLIPTPTKLITPLGKVIQEAGETSYGKALLGQTPAKVIKKASGATTEAKQESILNTVKDYDLSSNTWKGSINKAQQAFDDSYNETTQRLKDLSTGPNPPKVIPTDVLKAAKHDIVESQNYNDRPAAENIINNIIAQATKDGMDKPVTLDKFNAIKQNIKPKFTRGAATNDADALSEDVQKQLYFSVINKLGTYDDQLPKLGTQQKNLMNAKNAFEEAAAKQAKKPVTSLKDIALSTITAGGLGAGGGQFIGHSPEVAAGLGIPTAAILGARLAGQEGRYGRMLAGTGQRLQQLQQPLYNTSLGLGAVNVLGNMMPADATNIGNMQPQQ